MFAADVLNIDPEKTATVIEAAIRQQVLHTLRKRGAVLGLSGGVDSSVVVMLCARALGPERVLGLFMPERASADESLDLGRLIAETAGVRAELVPIAATLDGSGCYRPAFRCGRHCDCCRRVGSAPGHFRPDNLVGCHRGQGANL